VATDKDRALLRDFISALSDLSSVTAELFDKQLGPAGRLINLGPKYAKAAADVRFWQNAVKGLKPQDVATLFFILGKQQEMAGQLQKFGTMKPEEQKKVVYDYKELSKTLSQLKKKLS
jgi:hypothetical protein